MEFKKSLRVIARKLWLVVLLVTIAASGTYYYSKYVMEPVYESHVKLYIMRIEGAESKALNYDDILVSLQLMQNYTEIIKSRTFISNVLNGLGISNIYGEDFADKIQVKLVSNTNIMDITVSDNDPVLAQKYAKYVGEVFVEKVKTLAKEDSISYVDEANLPQRPSSPNVMLYVALSSILALIVSISIIVLTDILNDSIKTVEEVEKRYGLKVLGTLPNFKLKTMK